MHYYLLTFFLLIIDGEHTLFTIELKKLFCSKRMWYNGLVRYGDSKQGCSHGLLHLVAVLTPPYREKANNDAPSMSKSELCDVLFRMEP